MAQHVCPVWVGYLLVSPLRKLFENPEKRLKHFIEPGMTVLEPGSGMGYFTLPMADMVGPWGSVLAVDVQQKMLDKVRARAARAGLGDRIETRLAKGESLDVEDLAGQVDFTAAIHVVHEVPKQELFFTEVHAALKPGGRLLIVEPKGHVNDEDFAKSLELAQQAGLEWDKYAPDVGGRNAVLVK
jgi:ubiquinone/menaquinone biosynthesis C-methylase UbiE